MKKIYYKYKIYIDNKPVFMVAGSKDYTLKEIGQYFSEHLTTGFNEIKVEEDYIEVFGVLIGSNMLFCQDGAIFLNTDCCFKEKATPQQMWQIIKGLIGE